MSKNAKNPFDRLEDEDRFGPWPEQSLAFLQMIDRTQFQKPRCIALEGWDTTTIKLVSEKDQGSREAPRTSRDDSHAVQNLLVGLSETKLLAGPSTPHAVDEMAAALFAKSPNFAPAIEAMRINAQLKIRQGARWLHFRPIVIESEPGAGKTRFVHELGNASGLPLIYLDCATMNTLTPILGQDSSWSHSRPSEIMQAMSASRIANPFVALDELDKLQNHGRNAHPKPSESLVGLLEATTAKAHLDHYTQATLDMRFINWIILVNDLNRLSKPFLDRCQVIRLPKLTSGDFAKIAAGEIERRGLEPELVEPLAKAVRSGRITSLRKLNKALDAAEAASARPILN